MQIQKRNTIVIALLSLACFLTGLWAQTTILGNARRSGLAALMLQAAGGPCVTGVGLSGNCTSASPVAVDPTAVPGWLHTSASPKWTSIAPGAHQEQTITLAGAAIGDAVMAGVAPSIEQGLTWDAYVSSANTVTIRYQNNTSRAITPASLPITIVAVKSL